MSNREAVQNGETEAQIEEFVRAAQDLHTAGQEWFYMIELNEQMASNDKAYMRRRQLPRKILSIVGIKVPPPAKGLGITCSLAAQLEQEGRLESTCEPAALDSSRHPRRRIYRLVDEPEVQAAYP